jgi:hypothetical protein
MCEIPEAVTKLDRPVEQAGKFFGEQGIFGKEQGIFSSE